MKHQHASTGSKNSEQPDLKDPCGHPNVQKRLKTHQHLRKGQKDQEEPQLKPSCGQLSVRESKFWKLGFQLKNHEGRPTKHRRGDLWFHASSIG